MKTSDRTISLENKPQDVVPPDELKKRLNVGYSGSISRFEDLHLLGMGGVSEVFSGKDTVLNREVAIKVLRPANRDKLELVEGFVREARATAQIDHPNIVPVHEMGVFDDAGLYFTMKKVGGETLRNLIERIRNRDKDALKNYSLRHLLEVFISAGQAVAYAHSRGVIHCDLKPGNIMLGEYGEVLVMDWGLVRYFAADDSSGRKLDLVGSLPAEGLGQEAAGHTDLPRGGTPAFMAPEMFTEKAAPSPATDQYALGCILYCILTNTHSPFPEDISVNEVMKRAAAGKFLRPRRRARKLNIPRELEAVCQKAMAADPVKRYKDVEALIQDIRNYLDNRPVAARPPDIVTRFFKLCVRHPLIPVTVITALIMTSFTYTWWQRKISVYYSDAQYRFSDILRNGDFLYSRALYEINNDELDEYRKNEEILRLGAEFDYFYTSIIEQLANIAAMGDLDEQQETLLLRLVKQHIHFARLARQTVFLERFGESIARIKNPSFERIIARDEYLQKTLSAIARREGEIAISSAPGMTVTVSGGEESAVKDMPVYSSDPVVLPSGRYTIEISDGNNSAVIPVYVYIGCRENFEFTHVPAPVSKCVPVIHPLEPEKYFYISSNEVTGAEYAAFIDSIRDMELRQQYLDGVLMTPAHLPVRGVTLEQAMAYCDYVSELCGMDVSLPDRKEWRLAAWGAPEYFAQQEVNENELVPEGGRLSPAYTNILDISPYGVHDMLGNVRELVNSDLNRPGFTITCGGSWLAPREYARPEQTATASGGEKDVGFRYIIKK